MRYLAEGERPKTGSTVEVIFSGTVEAVGEAGFHLKPFGSGARSWYFSTMGKSFRKPVIKELRPAPKNYVVGALYKVRNTDVIYKKEDVGWRNLATGGWFGDAWLNGDELVRLVEESE